MSQEIPNAASAEAGQEVERIRDIIFGAQMRDYQHQFEQVEAELGQLKRQIAALKQDLATAGSDQTQRLQQVHEQVHEQMTEADAALRDELQRAVRDLDERKVDRVSLGDLLIALGTQLKADEKA